MPDAVQASAQDTVAAPHGNLSVANLSRSRMKCKYMKYRGGCKWGCTRKWIKCHAFFDHRGCEYDDDPKCSRGWHYDTPEDYETWKKKRRRQISISSDCSEEERPLKKPAVMQEPVSPKELSSSSKMSPVAEEPLASRELSSSSKASVGSLEKALWHRHFANLAIDITTCDDKTSEEIAEAYLSFYTRKARENAPKEQLLLITKSFHAIVKKKNAQAS